MKPVTAIHKNALLPSFWVVRLDRLERLDLWYPVLLDVDLEGREVLSEDLDLDSLDGRLDDCEDRLEGRDGCLDEEAGADLDDRLFDGLDEDPLDCLEREELL